MPRRGSRRAPTELATTPRARVLIAAVLGTIVALLVTTVWPWQLAVLAGWDVALAIHVCWGWIIVRNFDAAQTGAMALTEDLSHRESELVLIVASLMNLGASAFALIEATSQTVLVAGLINGATVLSVALSWTAVHTVYAFRYARLYYQAPVGGIDFEGGPPDYRDFAYLAFTIGMTYQVSDTQLSAREMRKTALRHALLSFVFVTSVVAMTINIVAQLFTG
jgi:uncharacterized membrane protein